MAIALDTTTNSSGAGTSLTFSHTCTGSNRILFVGFLLQTSSDFATGVTYNGVAMTQINTIASTNRIYLYVLHAPASGANNIVISLSSSAAINAIGVSYTGAKQTSTVDSSATNGFTTTTSLTTSTTVVASNCWLVMMGRTESSSPFMSAGTGTTLRQNQSNNSIAMFDSNGTVGTGSQSLQTTQPSGSTGHIIASFAPQTDVTMTAATGTFTLTGYDATFGTIIGTMIASVGNFILTGYDMLTRFTGWSNQSKNSSTFTNNSKNSSTWTNTTKS